MCKYLATHATGQTTVFRAGRRLFGLFVGTGLASGGARHDELHGVDFVDVGGKVAYGVGGGGKGGAGWRDVAGPRIFVPISGVGSKRNSSMCLDVSTEISPASFQCDDYNAWWTPHVAQQQPRRDCLSDRWISFRISKLEFRTADSAGWLPSSTAAAGIAAGNEV
jgi:hypothetical protein